MKLAVKVTPGARRNELLGWEEQYPGVGRVLKLKIAAPPIEGRANKAIERYMAEILHLPVSSGRIKLLHLPDEVDLSPLMK